MPMSEHTTSEALQHHWALDSQASDVLAERIDVKGLGHVIEDVQAGLDDDAVEVRDNNRRIVGDIFRGTGKKIIIIGPCSLDVEVDYVPLYDYIDELQEENPEAVIALRANGAKPRTATGWSGLWYGLDPAYRESLFETYQAAFNRGLPLITEITEGNQIGALGPYLSGVWMGARDIEPTAHRGKFAAYHLPTGVKNGATGDLGIVENTVKAIRSNSADNDNSGVDLGTIASGPQFAGIPTGIVPVGEGNPHVAIFTRGYELPADMPSEEKRAKAFEYISQTNLLGRKLGSAVVIDGTHSVPPMFDIDRKSANRLVPVLEEIHKGIESGEIVEAEELVGVMGEVGIVIGRTDPNYVLDGPRKEQLRDLINITVNLL